MIENLMISNKFHVCISTVYLKFVYVETKGKKPRGQVSVYDI